jgi:hypothetical protein
MFKINSLLEPPEGHFKKILQSLVCGTLGGMFATCFNAPFDVIKSRTQSQIHDA